MPQPTKCPKCNHEFLIATKSSLPINEVKRLEFELMDLRHKLEFSCFEGGIYFERLQELKSQIHLHEETCEINQAEQKDFRLRILALEQQMQGGAVDSGEKRSP